MTRPTGPERAARIIRVVLSALIGTVAAYISGPTIGFNPTGIIVGSIVFLAAWLSLE